MKERIVKRKCLESQVENLILYFSIIEVSSKTKNPIKHIFFLMRTFANNSADWLLGKPKQVRKREKKYIVPALNILPRKYFVS